MMQKDDLIFQLDMWVGPFGLKPKEEEAYDQIVKLIETGFTAEEMKEVVHKMALRINELEGMEKNIGK